MTAALRIVPMKRCHVRSCAEIAAASEPWKTLGETVDFSRYLSLKQAFVCLVGGEPAGFIIFTPEPVFARGGYLRAIGVSQRLRRQGIGKKLMSFAEHRTSRRAPNFYLCVSSFNRQAQAFYRDLGYLRVGRIPGLITPKTAEYIYWKSLA
jgi:[ribosomal protein S18]-alanine N-acetyltransferase